MDISRCRAIVKAALMAALAGCSGGGGGGDGPAADTTPPAVVSTVPANGATGVAVSTGVSAVFSEVVNASTVNTTTFTLRDGANNPVGGTVAYSGATATFTPAPGLAYSTAYTARITTGIADPAGNAMASEKVWSFTTAAWTPPGPLTGLTAVPGDGIVTLSWDLQPDSSIGYNVYWRTNPGVTKSNGNKIVLAPATQNHVHTNLTGGTTYYYVYTATLGGAESAESAEVSTTPPYSTSITRYSSDGSFAWQRGVNGLVTGVALAALPDGSSYVTGNFSCAATFGAGEPDETTLTQPSCATSADGPIEMFVARYRADGSLAWARQTQSSVVRQPKALAVLSDGSVIVVGSYSADMTLGPGEPNQTTLASTSWSDVFIARYADSGALLWARRAVVGSFEAGGNEARGVASLSDDSVVLTGSFFKTITFNPGDPGAVTLNTVASCLTNDFDVFVARYNPAGDVAWAKRAGGCDWEEGLAVAALPGDGSALTGRFRGGATFGPGEANQTVLTSEYSTSVSYDLFVASYEPAAGNLQWARAAHSSDVNDVGSGIATMTTGALAVTGSLEGATTFGAGESNETILSGATSFLARYSASNGALDWAVGIEGDFVPGAVASAPLGAATVAGSVSASATLGAGTPASTVVTTPYADILLARYDVTGALAWVKRVERGPSKGRSVSVLSDGSTLVLGNKVSP